MSLDFNLLPGEFIIIILLILLHGAYLKILLRLLFFYLFQQAEAIQVNPLYILIPCTLCTSFAFLLPVANPPNAIVFSYGHLKVIDMVSELKENNQVQCLLSYHSFCTLINFQGRQGLSSILKGEFMIGHRIVFKSDTRSKHHENLQHKYRDTNCIGHVLEEEKSFEYVPHKAWNLRVKVRLQPDLGKRKNRVNEIQPLRTVVFYHKYFCKILQPTNIYFEMHTGLSACWWKTIFLVVILIVTSDMKAQASHSGTLSMVSTGGVSPDQRGPPNVGWCHLRQNKEKEVYWICPKGTAEDNRRKAICKEAVDGGRF